MPPAIKRFLQSSIERHHAAPMPIRKRRNLIPSPLVICPEVGIVFHQKRKSVSPPPFRFRPNEHRIYEHFFAIKELERKANFLRDMEQINQLLPIDILIRSLQDQADRIEKPPEPIPIKIKVSPQIRRLKIRKHSKRHSRMNKMKKPERGQLIHPVNKPPPVITIEHIMATAKASEAQPKIIALLLISRLLDSQPAFPIHTPATEIIAHRRSHLYREEGSKWLQLFIPGASDDDEKIPSVFKMFDNTDEGIPEEFFPQKNEHSEQSIYQFRVLAKRFLINGDIDFEERFLLGEILGMNEEEINFFFMKLHVEKAISGKSEQEIRNLFFSTYKETVKAGEVNGDDIKDLEKNYEELVVPILNELFAD